MNAGVLRSIIICTVIVHEIRARLDIEFADHSIKPNGTYYSSVLSDSYPMSCLVFLVPPKMSVIRGATRMLVHVNWPAGETIVDIRGESLGCNDASHRHLAVSAISGDQQNTQWCRRPSDEICELLTIDHPVYQRQCTYRCSCDPACKWLRIESTPTRLPLLHWRLCGVFDRELPYDCGMYKLNGFHESGVYAISLGAGTAITSVKDVYCDMTTDEGGWTVLLRRQYGDIEFDTDTTFRTWKEYQSGFGSVDGDYWFGNENMNIITEQSGRSYSVRFDMMTYDGDVRHAVYDTFSVAGESDQYRLSISGYLATSDAGDGMTLANQMRFTTADDDQDHDESGQNCAKRHIGGWWYKQCASAKLTGMFGERAYHDAGGTFWRDVTGADGTTNMWESLQMVSMKIRQHLLP